MIILETPIALDGPFKTAELINELLKKEHPFDQDKEHLLCIGLYCQKVSFVDVVSLGSLRKCIAGRREFFRHAISKGCERVIGVHTHPHDNEIIPVPSDQDVAAVKLLSMAGRIIGIPVTDFIIIGENDYFSFLERYPDALRMKSQVTDNFKG